MARGYYGYTYLQRKQGLKTALFVLFKELLPKYYKLWARSASSLDIAAISSMLAVISSVAALCC